MPVTAKDLEQVRGIVRRLRRRPDLDASEMESDGMLALTIAVARWDNTPGLPAKQEGNRGRYLEVCVSRKVIEGLRRRHEIDRADRQTAAVAATQSRLSLDAPIADEVSSLHDLLGREDAPATLSLDMQAALAGLHPREREVLLRTLVAGETLVAVGRSWGVDESRAGQVRERALVRLGAANAYHGDLSQRELEVLALMADGLRNEDIAERLNLSVETVKSHVVSLRAKLGARSRTHAVALGFRSGLLH